MLEKNAPARMTRILAAIVFILSVLAFIGPFWKDAEIEPRLAGLLTWAALIQVYDGFRCAADADRRNAWLGGALSIIMAVLLINAPMLVGSALAIFVAATFGFDCARYAATWFRNGRRNSDALAAIGNLTVVVFIIALRDKGVALGLTIAVGLRIFGTGVSILQARTGDAGKVGEDILAGLGYTDDPEISSVAHRIEAEEAVRAPYDRSWIITFILILFFIHLGRMGFDRSFMGILSPLLAVIGDMFVALIIAYFILGPLRFAFRKIGTPLEKMLWGWVEKVPEEERHRFGIRKLVRSGLESRMRSGIRFRKASYSLPTAIRTGLQMGLPWAALLAAVMPVLGMSWYFDTENWASGVWDSWAAARTDIWREAMASVSGESLGPNAYRLQPKDVSDTGDFSFIVVGDPGEGDASQLILKDQILSASAQPGVKFLVISSDVIYPTGAMKDYEKKFYLPMKGVTKPVYAIPGNHDWYDALEGFAANFYRPDIARKAMQARVNRDLHISTTTERHIDDLIGRAASLRKEYGVPTGYQQAPFFQVVAGNFVLICVDTGVLRQVDSTQMAWIRAVLEASKGKFVMALLGHPFYAAGEYQGGLNPQFEEMHALFRQYKVPMVMAGDTHDMEYYIEPGKDGDAHTMHHFVNGGGGAYLSIGAAMTPPENMPTKEYAIYPSRDPLVRKIEDNTSWYKYPAWWWTRQKGGWPFSAEWLSAAFDYNVAPFFQSFMEVKVDRSHGVVRVIPYNNNGRMHWSDMTSTPGARATGAHPDDPVEWTIPLRP